MNKKKIYKILLIIPIFLLITILWYNATFAKIPTSGVTIGTNLRTEAEEVGNKVVGGIKVIGIFISVAMTMVIGMKYMLSAAEEKAEYKKTSIPYLVGAILIFACTQFIDLIYKIMN